MELMHTYTSSIKTRSRTDLEFTDGISNLDKWFVYICNMEGLSFRLGHNPERERSIKETYDDFSLEIKRLEGIGDFEEANKIRGWFRDLQIRFQNTGYFEARRRLEKYYTFK